MLFLLEPSCFPSFYSLWVAFNPNLKKIFFHKLGTVIKYLICTSLHWFLSVVILQYTVTYCSIEIKYSTVEKIQNLFFEIPSCFQIRFVHFLQLGNHIFGHLHIFIIVNLDLVFRLDQNVHQVLCSQPRLYFQPFDHDDLGYIKG